MLSFILATALSCPKTIVINDSVLKWNKHDQNQLEFVKDRCVVHYPDQPCLKRFIKKGFQNYWVICGTK